MNFTKKQLIEAFNNSHKIMQEELSGIELTRKIELLIKQFNFKSYEEETIFQIINSISLGLLPLSYFIPTLEKELGLNKEVAFLIADKIETHIFNEINKKIKVYDEQNIIEKTEDNEDEDTLIDSVENKTEKINEEETFNDIFNNNKTKIIEKSIDPYQETV